MKTQTKNWEKGLRNLWFRGGGQSQHFLETLKPFIRQLLAEQRTEILQEVENIMRDTLSVDTPKSHKEVNEMYQRLKQL